MKRTVLFSVLVLLLFAMVGCEKKADNEVLPEIKIKKILSGIPSKKISENGEIVIINSQEELNQLFPNSTLPKELVNLDFKRNTVILGNYGVHRGVAKVEHQFGKVGDKYEYVLTIILDISFVAEGIGFGIIVEKLPNNSEVMFKVNVIE